MREYSREDFAQPNIVDTERLRQIKGSAKGLAGILDDYDKAFEFYSEADIGREDAEAEMLDVETRDAEALRASLLAGGGDPGTDATEAANRAAIVAQERLRIAQAELRRSEDKVWAIVKANKTAMLTAATNLEAKHLQRYDTEMAEVIAAFSRASSVAQEVGQTYNVVAYYAGAHEGATFVPMWSVNEPIRQGRDVAKWYQYQLDTVLAPPQA